MGTDKDDRSQSLSTAYVPVIDNLTYLTLNYNTYTKIC